MTIETTEISSSHPGNGVIVAFDTEFSFTRNNQLRVELVEDNTGVVTAQTLDVHYSVTGRFNPRGGTVTMNAAPANGYTVVISRITAKVQDLALRNQTNYDPAAVEQRFDEVVQMVQEVEGRASSDGAVIAAQAAAAEAIAAAESLTEALDDINDLVAGNETQTSALAGSATALPAQPAGYKRIYINGVKYAIPYYIAGVAFDVFFPWGQSNAEGRGDSAFSPDATAHAKYFDGATFSPLADPVGGALSGSMWPSNANEWFALTGRNSVWVECATGSTRLLDYGDAAHSWAPAPAGTLRAPAIAKVLAVMAAIDASDDMELGNVYGPMALGEGDSENLDATHTAAMYKQALIDIATDMKAQIPQLTAIPVIRVASNINDSSKDAGYFAIRQAQEDACAESDLLVMAYRGTYSFRPLQYMLDSLHYTQPGLNLAGKCAARGLNSPESFPTLAAVTSNGYTDTDYATTSTTFTQSHSTGAGTKFLIVAVTALRPNSASVYTISGVTFNGVAMREARQQADNGTTACRAVAGIFYIDEATYGGSLASVTANIVVTAGLACNLFEVAAINSPDADYIDYANSANSPTDSQAALSLDYYTGGPAVTVAAAASCGPGAAAATCILSNVTTEMVDAGGTNGTRIGQGCVGRSLDQAAYGPRTITATFSANQNAIALCVASFRRRWNGE